MPTDLSRLSYTSRYACQRAHPLTCPNQKLALELDIIKKGRALEGEDRSALSYSRAISAIKCTLEASEQQFLAYEPQLSLSPCLAYPHLITSRRQVEKLPYLGTKILGLVSYLLSAAWSLLKLELEVEEFLDTGRIAEARLCHDIVRTMYSMLIFNYFQAVSHLRNASKL